MKKMFRKIAMYSREVSLLTQFLQFVHNTSSKFLCFFSFLLFISLLLFALFVSFMRWLAIFVAHSLTTSSSNNDDEKTQLCAQWIQRNVSRSLLLCVCVYPSECIYGWLKKSIFSSLRSSEFNNIIFLLLLFHVVAYTLLLFYYYFHLFIFLISFFVNHWCEISSYNNILDSNGIFKLRSIFSAIYTFTVTFFLLQKYSSCMPFLLLSVVLSIKQVKTEKNDIF